MKSTRSFLSTALIILGGLILSIIILRDDINPYIQGYFAILYCFWAFGFVTEDNDD